MDCRVLLIEDDAQIREVIRDYFTAQTQDCVDVICACSGNEGMERIAEARFDLAILDIMLPDVDGFALCREIRKESIVPVIFLTARGSEEDKLKGYLLGCDDYIVKPFSLAVLYAKVRALVKRAKGMVAAELLTAGAIELNPVQYTVSVGGKTLAMAPKEYTLLKYLMEHKNQVITREKLLISVWGYDFEGTDRVVDNHIKKLRRVLGAEGVKIKTIRKKGYQFTD